MPGIERKQLEVLCRACPDCDCAWLSNDFGDSDAGSILEFLLVLHRMHTMTYEKVSVLVPTRHRLERLRMLIDSYDRTTDGENAELVFRVDEDDRDSIQFLENDYLTIVGPRGNGYGNMPRFFNELAAAANGDVLLCGNDDMLFLSQDWPEVILAAASRFPDGLFDLGVTTHNETHFPFSIVSKRAVDHLGFLWDPRIFWGDIFLRDTMAYFGRAVMVPEVHITHDWAGFKPDKVFMETRPAKERVEGSASYWAAVHAPAVNEAVERLRGLLS